MSRSNSRNFLPLLSSSGRGLDPPAPYAWRSPLTRELRIEEFRAALRANPRRPIALADLGTWHLRAGNLAEAQALLGRAVLVKPEYALAHKHLGLVHEARGDDARGLHRLRRSRELDPDDAEAEKVRTLVAALESNGAADDADPDAAGLGRTEER